MNEVVKSGSVIVGGASIPLDKPMGERFIKDAARFNEGSLTEDEFRSHWGMCDAEWNAIGTNTKLLDAVQAEMRRRLENGDAARDLARFAYPEVVKGLVTIANSDVVSPRHRIEAARELRAISGVVKEDAVPETVSITINMGGDVPPFHVLADRHVPCPAEQGETFPLPYPDRSLRARTPVIDLDPVSHDDFALEQDDDEGSL